MFPGKTKRIHWSIEDPAAAAGTKKNGSMSFAAYGTSCAINFVSLLLLARVKYYSPPPLVNPRFSQLSDSLSINYIGRRNTARPPKAMIIEAVLLEVYGVVNLHLIVIFRRLFQRSRPDP